MEKPELLMSRWRPCLPGLVLGSAWGFSGYGKRHVRKGWFGTGETRLCSLVSKDRSYKPVVKASGAQRESDGVVVPVIAGRNPVGGKDPALVILIEKVTASAWPVKQPGPNTPVVCMRPDNVGRLQRRLWAAAKQAPERRFHALYDRIYRGDILVGAWRRVRANGGAAGVDGQTLAEVESYGVDRLLSELAEDLRAGRFPREFV